MLQNGEVGHSNISPMKLINPLNRSLLAALKALLEGRKKGNEERRAGLRMDYGFMISGHETHKNREI